MKGPFIVGKCPACKLGSPDITGKQEVEGTDLVIRFYVSCPTCGSGFDGQRYDDPADAVRYWNAGQGDLGTEGAVERAALELGAAAQGAGLLGPGDE